MRRVLLLSLVPLALAAGPARTDHPDTIFPHAEHEKLFPSCRACHAGIADGRDEDLYTVTQSDCRPCHDGTVVAEVEWEPPKAPPTNLVFDHVAHAARITGEALDCSSCHRPDGGSRMDVVLADVAACLDCHDTPSHFTADVDCRVCHAPLAEAAELPPAAIASFTRPADHEDSTFVFLHGQMMAGGIERCAVCHTRDSCEMCHLNSEDVPEVAALAFDTRVAEMIRDREGSWPAPPDHGDDFARHHGPLTSASLATCANCHTESSCRSCHGDSEAAWLAALPDPPESDRRGVRLTDARPPDHPPGFDRTHAAVAAAGALDCTVCHTEDYCEDCHQGSFQPGFHPVNYLQRHASEAWARDSECSACHSPEVFCRDCHTSLGLSPLGGVTGKSYHDSEPGWMISHGRAARQGLESCASCHQQTDCLACHSSKTGWAVNPHGPDFDPGRAADAAGATCLVCHPTIPR